MAGRDDGASRPGGAGGLRRALVALVACGLAPLLVACPPRTDAGGGATPPTGGGGRAAGHGGATDEDAGADTRADARAGAGDPGSDTSAQAADPGAAEGRPVADTGSYDETLEALGAPRPDRGRPGLAGAGGCEGGARAVGERWEVACNTCTCEASGEVTCTLMACTPGG